MEPTASEVLADVIAKAVVKKMRGTSSVLSSILAFLLVGLPIASIIYAAAKSQNKPSDEGPWSLVQPAQHMSDNQQIPAIYTAEIDGRRCLVLMGVLADSLDCEERD